MWDVFRLNPIGDFSLRKIATALAVIIMSALLWAITVSPQTAHAVDAAWDGDVVTYEGQRYEKETASIPGIPAGSSAYVYKQPDQNSAMVMYFPPGTNVNDATTVQYQSFTFSPPSTYTNPQTARQIGLEPKSGEVDRSFGTTGRNDSDQGEVTACAIKGIGWVICPTMRFLAGGMDIIFDLLKDYLTVKPLSFDSTTPIYRMWEVMRGFANIAFVLAFLIVIYSQVTGGGLNNYSLKKMLPRIIIAAILVNMSYVIVAGAVDISNILGHSLQQMFIDMRGNILGANSASNDEVISWDSMTSFILSGGTMAVAGGIAAKLALSSVAGVGVTGLIYLLLPFLLGVLLAVLVALLVLAARQAIIVILIVVAPLAFVAYLLPNTEKWFDKWKDLLMTMLLLFPIFSVIFGGSQLAGSLIVQTASNMNVVLLGMFVQVAPIVITPMLIKFSGGLLGKLAGIVNNPNKGLIDRTRNWSQGKANERRKQRLSQASEDRAKGIYNRRQFLRNYALRDHDKKHEKEAKLKDYEAAVEKRSEAHYTKRLNEMDDQGIVPGERATFVGRRNNRMARAAHESAYAADMSAQAINALDETQKRNAKAGLSNGLYESYNQEIKQSSQDIAMNARAAQSADYVVNRQLSNAITNSDHLQAVAAGIDLASGKPRAVASALSTRVNERSEGLKNLELMIDVKNLKSDELLQLASGIAEVRGIANNPEIREVAIKKIASGPDVGAIHKLSTIMDLSETSDEFLRTAFVDGLKSNSKKPGEFSAGLLDKLGQGVVGGFGSNGLKNAFVDAVKSNTFGSKGLVEADKDTLEHLASLLEREPGLFGAEERDKLERAIFGVVKNANLSGALDKRKDAFERIALSINPDILPEDF
ncbi:hypothetical protein I8H84_04590 [Candidatus Saccharibacteria bacterium]|nr:hypothetical protein [Candidatus Saccharibacteria bacterium]MBH1973386.1 hypothetical protein [Candidatus Saccharibacteria bacterium]MBH1990373.1 hypothetical protein [Candidatus Saccharibacteria bacterium]